MIHAQGQDVLSGAEQDVAGAMLVDVLSGSPADDAQLQGSVYLSRKGNGTLTRAGDLIVAIDGVRIRSANDLASFMARTGKRVGDAVTVRIVRDQQVVDVLVWLRARDDGKADQVGAI